MSTFPPLHGQQGNGNGSYTGDSYGVWGDADGGDGVDGSSNVGIGVFGISNSGSGVAGGSRQGTGVAGRTGGRIGVYGESLGIGVNGIGVLGEASDGTGVAGSGNIGVSGSGNIGVSGSSDDGTAVAGTSKNSYGVSGTGGNIGVYAQNLTAPGNVVYLATRGLAGDFYGEVFFHNTITKAGGGFQIDHPLDPVKKYLSHSFVESPDMKNIYDGVVVLDANGEAEVKLPAWFEALNTDFRYQLTCIGGYAPLYIAQEVQGNRFKIAGGTPRMKISWQVTGIRQDPWANAHRIPIEEEKPAEEQGYYLHPELHGESEEKSIQRVRHPKQE
jgi:hypothetical protein